MLLCFIFLIPLWMKKIGPNPIYGYCTKFARTHTTHWFHLNKLMAGLFLPLSGGLAIAELFLSDKELVWILLAGGLVGGTIIQLEEWRLKRRERRLAVKAQKQRA